MLKMCQVCQGTKKVKSIGMMDSECPTCEGLGKVDSEKVISLPTRKAAVPLKREALPADFHEQVEIERKAKLVDANCAYKNKPKHMDKTGAIKDEPAPIDEAKLNELREKIKPRTDDMLSAQKPALSESVKAELKALEDAKHAADEKEQVSAKESKRKQAKG